MDVQPGHGVVGMSLDTYYKNSANRQDAEEGNTCTVIAYAKSRAEITKAQTDVFNELKGKKLPEYKTNAVKCDDYITPYVSGYYGTEKQIGELADKCNSLIDEYNELLAIAKNEQDALSDARGKLVSFNESAGKDAKLFDKKLIKQFRLDAKFDNLVEEFKKMRLISAEAAKKAESPIDLLKVIYRKYEQEKRKYAEQQKANEVIQEVLTKKHETLTALNKQYANYIAKTKDELEKTKKKLSQSSQMSNALKDKQKELLNIQKLLAEKDGELKQSAKLVHNLTEGKNSLKDELAKEKLNLAQSRKNAARESEKQTTKMRELESQAEKLGGEKIQLEHELSLLKDRHRKLTEVQNTNRNLAQSVAVSGSEIKKLETALEAKDQELLGLKKEVSKLTNRVKKQESQFSEEQLKQNETIQDYQNKLKIVSDELAAKEEELKVNAKEISSLLTKCSRLEQSLQDKQKTVSDLGIKLDYDAKEIAKVKVQEKDLKSKIDAANNEIDSFKKMVANKKTEADEVRVQHDLTVKSLENALANKKEEVSKKDIEIKALRKEVSHLKNKVEASGDESVKIDERISQKEKDIIRLRDNLQSANEQINDFEEKLKTANSEMDLYKQKSSMASKTLSIYRVDTNKKIEELQSQYASAQELIKTLQQQNGELATELAKYDTDRVAPQIQVTESSEESQWALDEVTRLREQLQEAYALLHASPDNSLRQDAHQYTSLSAEQKSLMEQNDELASMYRKASDQQFQLEERVVELEEELKMAHQKLLEKARTQDDEASDAEFELTKANRSITQLNQQIRKMKRDHKEAISDLEEQLSREFKKAAEANYKALSNATAVNDVKALECVNEQLQNSLTELCDDLKGLLPEKQFNELMERHFGQVEQGAEVVEEHLPGFAKS